MMEDGKITQPPDMSSVFAAMAAVVASSGIDRPPTELLQPSTDEFTLVYLPRAFQFAGETFDESRFAFVGPVVEDRPFPGEWRPPAGERPVVLEVLARAAVFVTHGGVGRTLTPDTLTPETLRATVAEVAGDEQILANTRAMRKHAREAADVLEKYLADHR